MAKDCVTCRALRIDLGRAADRAMARFIYRELVSLGGIVDTQIELIDHLYKHFGTSHGTTHRYVDGLAKLGYLDVEYYRDGPTLKKRVLAVRRP